MERLLEQWYQTRNRSQLVREQARSLEVLGRLSQMQNHLRLVLVLLLVLVPGWYQRQNHWLLVPRERLELESLCRMRNRLRLVRLVLLVLEW